MWWLIKKSTHEKCEEVFNVVPRITLQEFKAEKVAPAAAVVNFDS